MFTEASGCDVTKRIVRPNGEVRYVRCVAVPIVENGVLKRIVGTAMDVTEHEQLAQELQRRQAYLAEAQRRGKAYARKMPRFERVPQRSWSGDQTKK
jgi:hypothetical protein